MFRKKLKLTSEVAKENPVGEIKDKYNAINSCSLKTLNEVNELLQFMTNLDYIKEVIQDADHQFEMVEGITASAEELNAATLDISDKVQASTISMNNTIEETGNSLNKINNTFELLENNINQINVVKNMIGEVSQETYRINDIVKIIKSVADQTNLLSLNASIEAARAGEYGKGFAIVATEIKGLAQTTSEQLKYIEEIVHSLNDKIKIVSTEVDTVVSSFDSSKKNIDEGLIGIKGINEGMNFVGDNFVQISASIEEESSATEEISSNLTEINEKAEKIRVGTVRTGKAFFDISQKVDGVRLNIIKSSCEKLDNSLIIELAKTDHLMWKWRVYNMILGYVKLDVGTVGNHHVCRLGKFVDTLDKANPKVNELLSKLEIPHKMVHDLAKEAIEAYEKNSIAKAEQILKDIEQSSKMVVGYLNELKKLI